MQLDILLFVGLSPVHRPSFLDIPGAMRLATGRNNYRRDYRSVIALYREPP